MTLDTLDVTIRPAGRDCRDCAHAKVRPFNARGELRTNALGMAVRCAKDRWCSWQPNLASFRRRRQPLAEKCVWFERAWGD